MESVCKFDHYDSYILGHRQKHLTKVFGLILKLITVIFDLLEFGDTVNDQRNIISELDAQFLIGYDRILNDIMKDTGYYSLFVKLELRQDDGDRKGMDYVRFP